MLSPLFALAFRSLFIISYSVAFVKHFFDFFFRSLPLSGGDSLFILPHLSVFVNTFFAVQIFSFRFPPRSPWNRRLSAVSLTAAFQRSAVSSPDSLYIIPRFSPMSTPFSKKIQLFLFFFFSRLLSPLKSYFPYLLSIHLPASSFSFSQSTFSPFSILEPVWFPVFPLVSLCVLFLKEPPI